MRKEERWENGLNRTWGTGLHFIYATKSPTYQPSVVPAMGLKDYSPRNSPTHDR